MKRAVRFDIAVGPGRPLNGPMFLRPTSRMTDGAVVNLPLPESVQLTNGVGMASLTVTPEDQSWVWVAEEGAGRGGVNVRRFIVPEGDGLLEYSDAPYADPPPQSQEWGPTAERARLFAEQAAGSADAASGAVVQVGEIVQGAEDLVDSLGGLSGIEEQVGRAEAAAGNADSQADRATTEADRAVAAADSIDTEALEEQIGGKIGRTDVADGTLFQRSGATTTGATVSTGTVADSIARRTGSGAIAVGTPTDDSHAVTKLFLDNFLGFYDVKWFGAVGNGTTDDTAALQAAINSGRPLYWGNRTYRITAGLSRTLTGDLAWRADGAKIVLDRATSIQFGITFNTGDFNVTIDGPITLDCQKKAFTGWYFNTTTATGANFYARGLGVRNNYRASQAFSSGDGIWVRGRFETVILDAPNVKNSLMAAGAGIPGSQGVTGITVSPSSVESGLYSKDISIRDPYIENVFCEDLAFHMDQDGIRVLTEHITGNVSLTETRFTVTNGLFKNCGGRAVKTSAQFGRVVGSKIERDSAVLGSGRRPMPEIDFQSSGGLISDIECQYTNAAPEVFALWSGTRDSVSGKRATGMIVDGVKISSTGNQGLPTNFMHANHQQQTQCVVEVSNVQVFSQAAMGHFLQINTSAAGTASKIVARLSGCMAAMETTSNAIYRNGTAVPTYGSIFNFVNGRIASGAITSYSGASTSGNFTIVLSGQNLMSW